MTPFLAHPLPVIYLGIIATALSNYLQTIGQRSITAERAALIYSMDPLYSAGFAYVFLQERIGAQGALGIALIALGVIVTSGVSARPSSIDSGKEVEKAETKTL